VIIETAQTRFTADDLLAEARRAGHPELTRRLITDWVGLGLLDKAEARGRGQGKGKDYTWPREQRGLFLTLLRFHRTVRRPVLCNVPVATWLLFGDQYVPLRQVRRALTTWLVTYRKVSFTKAKQGGQQVLVQLDHPSASDADRKRLERLVTQAGKTGHVDFDKLREAVQRVVDPNGTGIARGPLGMLDADAYVRIVAARVEGGKAVKDATDGEYFGARRMYQSAGPTSSVLRAPLEGHPKVLTPKLLGHTSTNPGLDAAVNNACLDLITLLGILRLNPPTTPGFATKEGPPPPRWPQQRSKLKKR
jgi:hypothetical protein